MKNVKKKVPVATVTIKQRRVEVNTFLNRKIGNIGTGLFTTVPYIVAQLAIAKYCTTSEILAVNSALI